MDISGDVTDAGRTDERRREDRATQPMEAGWLSFATHIRASKGLLSELTKRAPVGAYEKSAYRSLQKELLSALSKEPLSELIAQDKSNEMLLTLRSGVIPPALSAFFPQPTGVVS